MPKTPIEHLPIVDTHQHLWDLKRFKPPWLSDPAVAKIRKPSTMTEYRRATAGLNVVKTVYMEVDVAPGQQIQEADWVRDVCRGRKTPMRAATISARPGAANFEAYLRRYRHEKTIVGVRQVLQVPSAPRGLVLRPAYLRSLRLCGQWGKSFDLCMRPEELLDGAKAADRCPDTRFVLDHCGNATVGMRDPGQWRRDIAQVAKRKNVVCKISGIVKTVPDGQDPAEALRDIVRHTVDVFGPDRVMFGGDWPVCDLGSGFKAWVEALDAILDDASETERRKLFHDNAVRFYGLK